MDIVKDEPTLDNKWLPRLSPSLISDIPWKEVFSVAARIQALLIVLGALVAAALNGATPWGP